MGIPQYITALPIVPNVHGEGRAPLLRASLSTVLILIEAPDSGGLGG